MMGPDIHILQTGSLDRVEDGTIRKASSTVTLVCSRQQLIVIDSGASEDASKIIEALWSVGVTPAEISLVINTHGHDDHVGCNHLFTSAHFLAHAAEPGIAARFPAAATKQLVVAEYQIDPWVSVFGTPGHTRGSLSVLVKDSVSYFGAVGQAVVIAGDALPLSANYLKGVPPAIHWDRDASCHSMAEIAAVADWIVPGHDAPFRTCRTSFHR